MFSILIQKNVDLKYLKMFYFPGCFEDDSPCLILKNRNENECDYINASEMQLRLVNYQSKKYIAGMGPLPETIKDLWQLFEQAKVRIIVMATKEFEMKNGKRKDLCARYWPEKEGDELDVGIGIVTHLSNDINTNSEFYILRKFLLKLHDGTERIMHQFQIIEWLDGGKFYRRSVIKGILKIYFWFYFRYSK